MAQSRQWRVYYNNSTDLQRWSIDEGTPETEVTVIGISLDQVRAVSHTSEDGIQPRAWLTVDAVLEIDKGVAIFHSASYE